MKKGLSSAAYCWRETSE